MAGLLDFLNTPEAQTGLALLAAGGPTSQPMSAGQRIQMALAGVNAQQDAALKRQLLQSQVDENKSQNDLRQAQLQRQKRQDDYFLGGVGSSAPLASTSAPAGSPGGEALKEATGVPAGAPAPTQGKFNEWSQKYGIPVDALISDYFSNGGKGIAEMLMKRGTPDMQVTNGYAYDKNKVQPGFLPSLNTSQDGKSTVTMIDAAGMPNVFPTPGSVNAYGQFENVKNRSNAAFTPGRPVIMPGGRMGGQSQLQEITGATPAPGGAPAGYASEPQMRTTAQGDMGGTAEQYKKDIADIQASLKQPLDAGSRRLLQEQLQQRQQQLARYFSGQQAQAAPAQPVVQGGGLEFSPAEKAQQAAQQAQAVDTSKADVVRDTAQQADVKTANKFLNITSRVKEAFNDGPTQSGAGAMVDSAMGFFGKSTPGADASQRLKALGGWLVANVPRMEGPQSNFDVANYQVMAADVANDKLPLSRRKAALDGIEKMMQDIAGGGGLKAPAAGAQTATQPAAPKSFKDAGYSSPDQAIRDAQNTIMRNPGARAEVERRLQSIGLSLPGKTGSW